MQKQRGFTLVELLVASAIAFAVGWLTLRLVDGMLTASSRVSSRLASASAVDRLSERLDAEAAAAWSVFVPRDDVDGTSNTDGHEIDFVTEDAAHRQYWHAYLLDASNARVIAYSYAPGSAAVAGTHFDGVSAMHAAIYPVTALTDPSSVAYDPLFAGSSATAVDVDFGWNSQAVGGNHFARVTLRGDGAQRTLALASATAPTHFTVVIRYTPPP